MTQLKRTQKTLKEAKRILGFLESSPGVNCSGHSPCSTEDNGKNHLPIPTPILKRITLLMLSLHLKFSKEIHTFEDAGNKRSSGRSYSLNSKEQIRPTSPIHL